MRILSTDLLVADVIAHVNDQPELIALMEQYHLIPGGKRRLEEDEAQAFAEAFAPCKTMVAPGGSSANMLVTLSGLLGKKIEIRFVGVPGEGEHGEIIRKAMRDANIALLPEHIPSGVRTQEAVSYILVDDEGQCSSATYPGNAHSVLKPAVLPEHLVEHCDIVLMQGSLWSKLSEDFTDRLASLIKKHGRDLWLTLPTQAQISKYEHEKFHSMLPEAELLLGNTEELCRLYGADLDDAIKALQTSLRSPDRSKERLSGVAFITSGSQGCMLITRDSVQEIPAQPIETGDIVNCIGAGDTSYAGFAAGYLTKLSMEESAHIGMMLASLKLRHDSPRLESPLSTLKSAAPQMAKQL